MELTEVLKGVVEQAPGMGVMALFAYWMLRMLGAELRRYHMVLDGVLLRMANKLDRLESKLDDMERRR